MKKKFLSVICIFVFVFSGFALENKQKIWSIDSEVFDAIKKAYIIDGLALPSSSGPWSTSELLLMTELLDKNTELYDFIISKLTEQPKHQPSENLGFNFNLNINLETFIHTNTDSAFVGTDKWGYGLLNMDPFLQFDWETYATNVFYSFVGFDIRNPNHYKNGKDLGYKNISTNLFGFQNFEMDIKLNSNFPNRALIAFGGDNWSFLFGKDELSWGNGETGNFAISNNIPAQYMAKFSTFFNVFKYSFLTSFFPHQLMYYKVDSDGNVTGWSNHYSQGREVQGTRFYMAHRIEGRFFGNKLSAAVTEAIMYQSDDGQINMRFFNPVDIFHNYYIRYNANSTIVFEVDYAPIKKLNLYGQIIIDDLPFFIEPSGKSSSKAFPSAMGYMLGAKTSFPFRDGYFYGSFEAVKTDPFLYLRYKDNENTVEKDTYGIDYVVGYSDFSSGLVDEYFLGYTFGGDALVFNAKAGWTNLKNFSIIGNLFYMMHGTFDKWTKWSPIGNGTNPNYPKYNLFNFLTNSYPEQIYNNFDNEEAHTRNAISHTIDFGVKVNYNVNNNIKVFAQNDFIFVNNYGNHAGEKRFDYQLVLGAKFNFSL